MIVLIVSFIIIVFLSCDDLLIVAHETVKESAEAAAILDLLYLYKASLFDVYIYVNPSASTYV